AVVHLRLAHGFPDRGEGGEMRDDVGPGLLERALQRGAVVEVALDQRAPAHQVAEPARQAVIGDDGPAGRGERLGAMAADKASAAGDENCRHERVLLAARRWAGNSRAAPVTSRPPRAKARP